MATQSASLCDDAYSSERFYWGKKPSSLCDRVIEHVGPDIERGPTLIDLGCGEGRNAVYLARHGFRVTGIDLSIPGLEKLTRYAQEKGLHVDTAQADVRELRLEQSYDVVFSTGLVHYLPPATRLARFEHLKRHTTAAGIHAHAALVSKPFLPAAPDADPDVILFTSGELMGYFWDWEILYTVEELFDCTSGGVPHKHAIDRIIARRYAGAGG